ncbi:membrane protein [Lactococcus termiticola]|uniref:Membrane protein n=2 Tax=Lactococcus termiticola TaxID=2169526 RepID=A0A2R5HEB9_9LACT|nr:membrane protein [Lactococcus termiticola]
MRIAIILALNAGFMDGFSFFHFENRFIGAQSGNLIQAALELAKGNIALFLNFIIPIFFFIAGVVTRGLYSHYLADHHRFDALYLLVLQWLGVTITALSYALGLRLPVSLYVGIFSFFMAIQYDTFTKTHGRAYASIFMTGNLRSMSVNIAQYFLTKNKENLHAVWTYLSLATSFFVGAFVSVFALKAFDNWTMLGSSLLLGIVVLIARFERN